jgi:hypothetical protein
MLGDLLELFNTYRALAQHVSSILLAAVIWRWGGGPERWLIGVFVSTMVAPIYVLLALGFGANDIGPYAPTIVMVDVIAASLFITIALYANRNYPLWIAGFQVVAVVAHGVRSMVDTVSPLAHAILVIGPSYCQLLILFGGFTRHWLRRRRFGPYREWRLAWPGSRPVPL